MGLATAADGDSDDSIELFCLACVNPLDAGMRMRRVQDLPDEHAGKREVVGVFAGAAGFAGSVNHGDGLADNGEVSHWSCGTGASPVRSSVARQCLCAVPTGLGRFHTTQGLRPGLNYFAAPRLVSCLLLGLNRRFDCFIHLAVAGTAAEIAAKGFANVCFGRIRICGEQMFDRHHESGSAEATLRTSPVAVGFLDGGQRSVFTDAFDSGNLLAFATCGQHCAREHGRAVNQNRASSAGGIVAAALGAGEL